MVDAGGEMAAVNRDTKKLEFLLLERERRLKIAQKTLVRRSFAWCR